jgi:hypothetical protein
MDHVKPSQPFDPDFQDQPWTSGFLRPLLIGLLAASVMAGPLAVLRGLSPWRLGYALPVFFLAALEGVYSTLRLGRPTWRDRRGLGFRLGEVFLLLVVLRLAVWTFSTGLPEAEAVRVWLRQPGAFFEDQFILIGFLLLAAWGLAVGITGDFLELALQPDEVAAHESRARGESGSRVRAFRPTPRSEIVGRFAARWGGGGIALVACAALSRVTVNADSKGMLRLGLGQLGLPPDILAALLCYFLAGLLLISHARLALLRGHWYNEEAEIGPAVVRRWHWNSLLAVLLVAGLAALLPIGSTGWLAVILETIIALLVQIAYALLLILAFILSLVLYPLRFLFTQRPPEMPELSSLTIPTQSQVVSRLPDWLGGIVFWVVIALIVGYLLLNYLAAHGRLRGRWADLLIRLRCRWRARWARLGAAVQAAATALRARLRPLRPGEPVAASSPFVRLSKLSPRARVRYFYLNTLRRAAGRGLARPAHATPLEFARDLTTRWPDAGVDVEALTDAFLAARYDRRPISAGEARATQSVWRRVLAALHGRHVKEDK